MIIAGEDFDGTTPLIAYFHSGQLAGERLYFHIPIFDDTHLEKNESFYVLLYSDDAEIHIEKAVVYIVDDDGESNRTVMILLMFLNIMSFLHHMQWYLHHYQLKIDFKLYGKTMELCWYYWTLLETYIQTLDFIFGLLMMEMVRNT